MLKNFRVYALSIQFYRRCKALDLAPELKDQLARASSSVSLSIAEGYGRIYKKEKSLLDLEQIHPVSITG